VRVCVGVFVSGRLRMLCKNKGYKCVCVRARAHVQWTMMACTLLERARFIEEEEVFESKRESPPHKWSRVRLLGLGCRV
jgi:hypothetical protein